MNRIMLEEEEPKKNTTCFTNWELARFILLVQIVAIMIHEYLGPYFAMLKPYLPWF